MVKLLSGFIIAAAVIILFSPLIILNGWVVSWLWFWFVVPLGLGTLSVPHAIGIVGLTGILTKQYKGESNDVAESLAFSIVLPLVALAIGYITHLFM